MQRKRFIDDLNVILLDMGNTFMFECDRFGQGVDYHSTYRNLGGNRLSSGSISLAINRLFEHMLEISRNPEHYDRYGTVEGYLHELPESAGLPAAERKILERVFARHEVGRIPDSHVAILRELSHTHPLGVISNVWSHRSVFEEEFSRADVEDFFEIIIWSSDHGCIKPSPCIFRKALTHFDVEPERVAYVGDNPRRDVAGAKGVGMKAVWINSGNRELPVGIPQPDLTISDLGDLLTFSTPCISEA
jgi:putative hydrolase of the HAD superfamily